MDTDQDLTTHKYARFRRAAAASAGSFVLRMNRYRNFTRHTCPMRHRVIFQKQLSVMLAHNGIDDIQSHTIVRLCSRAALILHIELLLPPLKRLHGKTRSRIRYGKDKTASVFRRPERDRSAPGRVFHRIVHKVQQRSYKKPRLRIHLPLPQLTVPRKFYLPDAAESSCLFPDLPKTQSKIRIP